MAEAAILSTFFSSSFLLRVFGLESEGGIKGVKE